MEIIQVCLPAEQIEQLSAIAAIEHSSREDLIRKAVTAYVERNKPVLPRAFGIWKDRLGESGIGYQERLRAGW